MQGSIDLASTSPGASRARHRLTRTTVELYLKAGRTPFDVNSVYLKTGKRFRVALKYLTDCRAFLARRRD
jgi:hypothetical protein